MAEPAFAEAYRVLRPDRLWVSFCGWQEADQFIEAWRLAGFRIVGHLVFCQELRVVGAVRRSKGRTSRHSI